MNKQKGFTLIELVIVIAVLGILAAIAIPKFVALQDDALVASKKGMSGAVKSAHAVAIADLKKFPTVTELADYVNGEGVAPAADDTGIMVVIDDPATPYKVPTYNDSKCTTATATDAGASEDVVKCVGSI
jgi:MSHA pilin protein MshA